jgi:hypothetical protein
MTLHIEDLICRLASDGVYLFSQEVPVWSGDRAVIQSLAAAYTQGRAYTQKQRDLVMRLVKKYQNALVGEFGKLATDAIDLTSFRFPVAEAKSSTKYIKIENKKILVSFPYSEKLVENIKKFKASTKVKLAEWDVDKKVWAFDLEESNVLWVANNLMTPEFTVDDNFLKIFEEITQVLENIEDHVPILVNTEAGFKFANGHKTLPDIDANNVIEAVLLAKHYGISVWDEKVSNLLKNEEISPVLDKFINETGSENLNFDSSTTNIDQFKDLFKFNVPVLIVIPAGYELKYLKNWYFWLKSQNFQEKDISVMFRLENTVGRDFNDYVRTFELNTPLHENTKIVFISQKLPKPIIKSGIDFKFVLNLGNITGVHYSITSYLQNEPCMIKYTDTKQLGYRSDVL